MRTSSCLSEWTVQGAVGSKRQTAKSSKRLRAHTSGRLVPPLSARDSTVIRQRHGQERQRDARIRAWSYAGERQPYSGFLKHILYELQQ